MAINRKWLIGGGIVALVVVVLIVVFVMHDKKKDVPAAQATQAAGFRPRLPQMAPQMAQASMLTQKVANSFASANAECNGNGIPPCRNEMFTMVRPVQMLNSQ